MTNSFHCTKSNFPNFNLMNMLQVLVKDNNIEAALRSLKRKMQREGVLELSKTKNILKQLLIKREERKKNLFKEKEKIQIKFDVVL